VGTLRNILILTAIAALSACAGPATLQPSSASTSPSPLGGLETSPASTTPLLDPAQLAVEAFLRTDPEVVRRFGATPHDGRLACAFAPIVPRRDNHLFARFLCLEVMGTGPGAYSISGSASSIAMIIDPASGAVRDWRTPRDGADGRTDLLEMFPADVMNAFRSADTATANRQTSEMQSRCLAIANELAAAS